MTARQPELNLLPKEVWEKGAVGQLFKWVLSSGRYVVVFTELVVISAFLYRFGLDRTLTDLKQSIANKQEIVTSYSDLETGFRLVQTKLETIKTISADNFVVSTLNTLGQMTPADAVYSAVTVNRENVILEGRVTSQTGLATLLQKAQGETRFQEVILENVQSAADDPEAIEFRMILTFSAT